MQHEVEDPAHEVVGNAARAVVMAASVAAESLARLRAQQRQSAAAAQGAEAEQLQARWESERQLAWTHVQGVDSNWLAGASVDDVAHMWQTAHAWQGVDQRFGPTADLLAAGIKERYGVDIEEVTRNGDDLAGHLRDQADRARAEGRADEKAGHGERSATPDAAADTLDELGATVVLVGAANDRASDLEDNAHSNSTEAESLDHQADEISYDTDARRAALADRMSEAEVPAAAIGGRIRAAEAQAKPVREASRRQSARPRSAKKRAAAPRRTAELDR